MEVNFTIADKSPLLHEDAEVVRKSVRITRISSACLRFCAMRYLTVLLQNHFRSGKGEYGKLEIGGERVLYEEI